MIRRTSHVAVLAACALASTSPRLARATPSTAFWAPSTPAVQAAGVLHVTYDTYFGTKGAYAVDTGLTIGVLPGKTLQAEVGFDLFYPSITSAGPLDAPIALNGKVGAPEDTYFKGQPAWSFGIFGAGLEDDYNDQNVLYGVIGKTFPKIGMLSVGGYYGLNEDLLLSSDGEEERSGLLASWISPGIDVPKIDKVLLVWDVQTGKNVLGAVGGGAYVYFTPTVDLLVGPVVFFDGDLQPGGSKWLWSVQLDVDLDL